MVEAYNYFSSDDESSDDGFSVDSRNVDPSIPYVPIIRMRPHAHSVNPYAFVSPRRPSMFYVGLPPNHHNRVSAVWGRNSNNFWLPDSGTSAHMTPQIEDIFPGTLETYKSDVTVANSKTTKVTHRGTVHIVLQNYIDSSDLRILPLFGVLVVPKLASRLLSTDQLTFHRHTVTFNQLTIDFGITEALRNGRQDTLSYRLPRQYEVAEGGRTLEWPVDALEHANQGCRFLIGPGPYDIANNTNSASAPYSHKLAALVNDEKPTDENITALAPTQRKHKSRAFPAQADVDPEEAPDAHDITPSDAEKGTVFKAKSGKRHIGCALMHNRLGHRSVGAILLANKDDLWNDVSVTPEPDKICKRCRITLSRKANRSKVPPI